MPSADSATSHVTPTAEVATPHRSDGSLREARAVRGTVIPTRTTASVSSAAEPTESTIPAAVAAATLPAPALAEGRTDLGNGIFAMRDGRVVTVYFDTPLGRTRKPDKFEATVRATLPRVYGAVADSALARVPRGDIASLGNPATDLAATGIRLPAGNGVTLALWPETRPGQDGPLAVSYRATVVQ